jgi:hypothetical protein
MIHRKVKMILDWCTYVLTAIAFGTEPKAQATVEEEAWSPSRGHRDL